MIKSDRNGVAETQAFLVRNGNETLIKDWVNIRTGTDSISAPIYSSDRKSVSFVVNTSLQKYFVLKDGVVSSGLYYSIADFTYSPDNKGFAFVGRKDGKMFVVQDGKELGNYELTDDSYLS